MDTFIKFVIKLQNPFAKSKDYYESSGLLIQSF